MDEAKVEVLRYLGRRQQVVPAELDEMVTDCLTLMRETVRPRRVTARFSLVSNEGDIFLPDIGLALPGLSIRRHLKGCGEVLLLAATLGVEADKLIHRFEHDDFIRSVVLDACGSRLIEEVCDESEQSIRAETVGEGLFLTRRFSPGYGDLPLTLQPRILAVLNANRRIGLTCTDSLILLPRKSVTAIMGLSRSAVQKSADKCDACPKRDACAYVKE
jgi:hypothetical protein